MRVILMHNPTAGSADHTAEHLVSAIRQAGHEVVREVCGPDDLAAAIRVSCDLVAVAGGDGTVGSAAKTLVGSGIPLAVIPLGTANNIARTLGFARDGTSPDKLIATWAQGSVHDFDAATATVDGHEHRFLECFGFGVFPETIAESKRLPEREDPDDTLRQHLALVRALVATGTPRPYSVQLDGIDRSNDYLLVEVMNVPFVGPHLVLAPNADPHDGLLDVVLLQARDREPLLRHIDAIIEGRHSIMPMAIARARHVAIGSSDDSFHRDGHLEKMSAATRARDFSVRVEPGALRVLRQRA